MKTYRIFTLIILMGVCFSLSAQINLQERESQATVLLQQGEYDKCIACLERTLAEIRGTSQESFTPRIKEFIAMTHVLAGQKLYSVNKKDEGKAHFEKALALVEPETEAYQQMKSIIDLYYLEETITKTENIARELKRKKEYEQAIALYQELITRIQGTAVEYRTDDLKEFIAICQLYQGTDLFKASKAEEAKQLYEQAIANSQPGSKVNRQAHSMMGQWYSIQAANLRNGNYEYEQSLAYSLKAEEHFDKAQKPIDRLKEQISRAETLQNLHQEEEAEELLKQIIQECGNKEEFEDIRGTALYEWGKMEKNSENLQSAIEHLETAYTLCRHAEDKTHAYLPAKTLLSIYTYQIPDKVKQQFWQQIVDELEPQIKTK